ncbi:MAG: TIGR04282 family arsenosugar biosynthesis glycosyltransferase [Ferruginibacter sp.]
MERALIIFIRNPRLGKVKTRLAATIGDEKALEVYRRLLQHTWEIVNNVTACVFIFVTETLEDNNWRQFTLVQQEGEKLGEKMSHAFQHVFSEGYKSVVIIGSDCPELLQGHINDAFNALVTGDLVIGPAKDGGYYLLGMRKFYPGIFENISWSTSKVFEKTIDNARLLNLTVDKLEMLSDLDEVNDMPPRWIKEMDILI